MFDVNEINLTAEEAQEILDRTAGCRTYIDMTRELADYGCEWDSDGADLVGKAYWTIHKAYTFGVCAGRHEMPVNNFIFDEVIDPTNIGEMMRTADEKIPDDAEHIDLYITGLTPATLAIVSICSRRGITLNAYNYDRNTGKYKRQPVL